MKSVLPSEIDGKIQAPASKSLTIRGLAASLLAPGKSVISSPSFCDDALVARRLIQKLGAEVEVSSERIEVTGGFPEISRVPPEGLTLSCGESGLTMRLFAPLVALQPNPVTLDGVGTLLRRPMDMLESALTGLGALCQSRAGYPPILVRGALHPGRIELEAFRTSQLLSGLLLSLPLLAADSEILVPELKSKPYVDLTLEVIQKYGGKIEVKKRGNNYVFLIPGKQLYRATHFEVEGDWSGASFFLVAGALAGRIEVVGLNPASQQADSRIIEALQAAGALVLLKGEKIVVEKAKLQAFEFDASDCPDLFPPLCVLAAGCRGQSRIRGAERLAFKESHRAKTLVQELRKIGVAISSEGNSILVSGSSIQGGETESHADHRITMACAIAGLISRKGVSLSGWEAVHKSYPDFFAALESCGGRIK